MSEPVMTGSSVPFRRRPKVVAAALATMLAVGAGVGIAAHSAGGSAPVVSWAAAVPPSEGVTAAACRESDIDHLLGAVTVMPPNVATRILGTLSPDLSETLQGARTAIFLSRSVTTPVPPPPDGATLGATLDRLNSHDADAIMSGLPPQERAQAVLAEQSAAYRFALSSPPPACW